MKLFRPIFTIIAVLLAMPAMGGQNCKNPVYARANPYKCAVRSNTVFYVLGGAAVAATTAAAVAATSGGGGGGGGSAPTTPMPTIQIPDVRGADVSTTRLAAVINDTEYSRNLEQYNDIRLAYSRARGYSGATSHIAVLDNGAASWHGGNVASVAQSVAPGATISQHRITDDTYEFLPYAQIGNVIAATPHADIFNASWSVSMRATDVRSRTHFERLTHPEFVKSVSDAAERGAIFVWAAGNDSATQSSALSAMPMVIPELRGHFINVVAWDTSTGSLAEFSNACGVTKDFCLAAPGTDLDTGTDFVSGTSFAAPVVSAAVATLREAFPHMTATQITALLLETARDVGAPGVDNVYGHGLLDMERATRPVGAAVVPIGNEMSAPLRRARVSGQVAKNIKSSNIHFAFFDKYGRPFKTSLAEHLSVQNPSRAMDHIRGERKLAMNFGTIEMGFKQNDFVLGEGLLRAESRHSIGFIGLNHKIDVGRTSLHGVFNIGQSRPMPVPESMISKFSTMYNATASISAKRGNWYAQIAAPDIIVRGNLHLRTPMGRGANGDILFTEQTVKLGGRPSVEYTIGYKFLSATFVDNPYGTDEVFFIAKTKTIF